MAEKASSTNKALEQLKDQLTCPVCLEHFTAPKTLPCLHSFCQGCLGQFVAQGQQDHTLSCPICRHINELPVNGIAGLQSAFHLNSLLDIHGLLNKINNSQQKLSCGNCPNEQAVNYCSECGQFICKECSITHKKIKILSDHNISTLNEVASSAFKLIPLKKQPIMECTSHNKPLEVYCDTCEQLVCHLCTIRQHRDHECDPMSDIFHKHKQQILEELQPVEEKLASAISFKESLERQEGEIMEQSQTTTREINDLIEQLVKVLRQSQKRMCTNVHTTLQANMEKLSARKEANYLAIGLLQSVKQFTDEELRIGSPQQILVMKKQMVDRMRTVRSQVKEEDLQPLEAKFKVCLDPSLLKACSGIGLTIDCVNISGKGSKTSLVSQKSTFILDIKMANGNLLSTDLLSYQIIPCGELSVVYVTGGQFEVTYSCPAPGPHQLLFKVGGADIPGSPFTIHALPSPKMHANPVRSFTGLIGPHGVAITKEGNLVVSVCHKNARTGSSLGDVSHIVVLNPTSGKVIRRIGKWGTREGELRNPMAVAVTANNNIVVADTHNDRVQMFTMNGDFISLAGNYRSHNQLRMEGPAGVAIHYNGKIFISDDEQILVLNSDLSFSHRFGRKGRALGQLNRPRGIAFDSQGMVYVADTGNQRIQKFTPEGEPIGVISGSNRGNQFTFPGGICIDNYDFIYVTDNKQRTVSMFSPEGEFLGYIGSSDGSSFSFVCRLAVHFSGTLYIADDDKVVVY